MLGQNVPFTCPGHGGCGCVAKPEFGVPGGVRSPGFRRKSPPTPAEPARHPECGSSLPLESAQLAALAHFSVPKRFLRASASDALWTAAAFRRSFSRGLPRASGLAGEAAAAVPDLNRFF